MGLGVGEEIDEVFLTTQTVSFKTSNALNIECSVTCM
jgi:hypothetical protein